MLKFYWCFVIRYKCQVCILIVPIVITLHIYMMLNFCSSDNSQTFLLHKAFAMTVYIRATPFLVLVILMFYKPKTNYACETVSLVVIFMSCIRAAIHTNKGDEILSLQIKSFPCSRYLSSFERCFPYHIRMYVARELHKMG